MLFGLFPIKRQPRYFMLSLFLLLISFVDSQILCPREGEPYHPYDVRRQSLAIKSAEGDFSTTPYFKIRVRIEYAGDRIIFPEIKLRIRNIQKTGNWPEYEHCKHLYGNCDFDRAISKGNCSLEADWPFQNPNKTYELTVISHDSSVKREWSAPFIIKTHELEPRWMSIGKISPVETDPALLSIAWSSMYDNTWIDNVTIYYTTNILAIRLLENYGGNRDEKQVDYHPWKSVVVPGSPMRAEISGLNPNLTYFFTIKASNKHGTSKLSSGAGFSFPATQLEEFNLGSALNDQVEKRLNSLPFPKSGQKIPNFLKNELAKFDRLKCRQEVVADCDFCCKFVVRFNYPKMLPEFVHQGGPTRLDENNYLWHVGSECFCRYVNPQDSQLASEAP